MSECGCPEVAGGILETRRGTAIALGPAEAVEPVAEAIVRADPDGTRFGQVIRDTIDQLLDGQRTGRYRYEELYKTEKTHLGTLVEINLQREFAFGDGVDMDYSIAGVEVDCKFSAFPRGWQLPVESVGHICLLVWADDGQSRWSAGLLRIEERLLGAGRNRDLKRTLNDEGFRAIRWLWQMQPLPENLLLHLDAETRAGILPVADRGSGQRRIDELFRRVQRRIITRSTVLTVGQQDDAPKRVRDSRGRLREEGIIILGHQGDHSRVARTLGLPLPRKGEWVSVRVVPAAGEVAASVTVDGRAYRCATEGDPPSRAPRIDAGQSETS